jgi:S1-C subfamily serine protease
VTVVSRLLATLVGLVALGPVAGALAQALPPDLRPFVRLDYELILRRYRDPVVRWGEVVDPGMLVEGPRTERRVAGSGSVVTRDGLILTNVHVYRLTAGERITLSEDRKEIVRITPLSREMLVAEIDPRRPLGPAEVKYRARLVAAYPDRDMAVLKITALASGAPLPPRPFSAVPLGNPYAIPLGADLRILGYPAKGGESVTPSRTEFAGFTTGAPDVIDGSFKTLASVAGGNSGGAALHDHRLVGIPTRVSYKAEKGADFAYIHPVTWAIHPLALAALREGHEIPRIDRAWVDSPHNTDVTRTRTLLGGTVRSLMTARPVPGPLVVIHRADRSYEQILALEREVESFRLARKVQELAGTGLPAEALAPLVELPAQTVRELLKAPAGGPHLSADARKYLEGEFYAVRDRPRDGFFLVAAPRKLPLQVVVSAEGFRRIALEHRSGDGLFESLGTISLAPDLMRPDPPGR